MISEKIKLLGAGLYKDIPDELTLKSIPTASELDYVGSEDFQAVMLDKIFPRAIEEKINFHNLLEIDFHWICRCLRFLNYGPYYTTNTIYCGSCGKVSKGDYQVDLRSVNCITLPEGFVNSIRISKDEFIDFDGDVVIQLPTIQDMINAYKDQAFTGSNGKVNKEYARICYMIRSIKNENNLTPINVKIILESKFSAADYLILKDKISELGDYGLRAGGSTTCPKCGQKDATFIALVDDRFLRPTLGDLKRWRADRRTGDMENSSGDQATAVRKHN